MPTYTFTKELEPYFIGADQYDTTMKALAADIAATTDNPDSFPHYNVYHVKDAKQYIIELNVPGYSKSEIDITLDGNLLAVEGTKKVDFNKDESVFDGIAFPEKFTRSWRIMNGLKVDKIDLSEGVLVVKLLDTSPSPVSKTIFPVGYPKDQSKLWVDPTVVPEPAVASSVPVVQPIVAQPTAVEPKPTPEAAVKAANKVVAKKTEPSKPSTK